MMLARRWQITGTTIATQACQAGLLIYAFSVLALPLEREFGTTRAEVMLATTCLSFASSALAAVAGWLVDRRSVRNLMLFGAVCLAAGFVALSQARAIWHVWLAYALVLPWANVLLGQMTSATLITRWFEARRGRAMGISSLGTSIGGFAFPAIVFAAIETLGWRTGVVAIGALATLVLVPLILATVRDRPDAADQDPDQARAGEPTQTTRAILANPAFWIITFAIGIKMGTYFGLLNNLGGYLQDLAVDTGYVAMLVALLSVTSAIGKVVFGALAERYAPRWLFIFSLVLNVVGFAILWLAGTLPALIVASLILGFATGGMFPLWSLITADYFGKAAFGRALGLMNFLMVPLTAGAAPLAGHAHDVAGNYDAAIVGAMAVLVVSIVLLAMLKPPAAEARA